MKGFEIAFPTPSGRTVVLSRVNRDSVPAPASAAFPASSAPRHLRARLQAGFSGSSLTSPSPLLILHSPFVVLSLPSPISSPRSPVSPSPLPVFRRQPADSPPGKGRKTRKTARKTRKNARTQLFSFFPLRARRGFGILANVFATPSAPRRSLRAEPFCRSRSRKAGRGDPRGAERRTRRGRRRRTPEEGDGAA